MAGRDRALPDRRGQALSQPLIHAGFVFSDAADRPGLAFQLTPDLQLPYGRTAGHPQEIPLQVVPLSRPAHYSKVMTSASQVPLAVPVAAKVPVVAGI
jgi:hypothetical protein